MTRQAVLDEALKLSVEDRTDVAVELLASLEGASPSEPESVAKAWGSEIERRARRVLAGETRGISWAESLRGARTRLADR